MAVKLASVPADKAHLKLVAGAPAQRFTLSALLHFLYVFLPHLTVTLPFALVYNHLLLRFAKNGIVRNVGRPAFSDYIVTLTRYYLGRTSAAQGRLLMNRTGAYTVRDS